MFRLKLPVMLPRLQGTSSRTLARLRIQPSSAVFTSKRTVKTSTLDWKPIKSTHNPNAEETKRRPIGKFIVLALMVAMPITTLYLGTWQLRRLEWKTKLIASCESRLVRPPIPLPKNFTEEMCEDWEYRRVTIRGKFLHDEELFVGPRARNGEKGYLMFTPFVREDTGEKILVERGWISETKVSPDTRTLHHLSLPTKTIEITCLIRPPKKRGAFQWKQKDPESRLWQVSDIYDMAQSVGCRPVHYQMLYDLKDHRSWMGEDAPQSKDNGGEGISSKLWRLVGKESSQKVQPTANAIPDSEEGLEFDEMQFVRAGVPIGKRPVVDFRNNHLQYLVTWYGLSFLSTIFLIVALRKYRKGNVLSQAQSIAERERRARRFM